MAYPLSGCHLWPCWFLVCVFVGCVLGNTSHDKHGAYLLLYMLDLFIVCMASEFMVLHLYNKSPVTEHQFTVCGLFDFAYFVCVCVCLCAHVHLAVGSRFHNCGGSQSTGLVQQGAVIQIRPQMLPSYFFSVLYSLLAWFSMLYCQSYRPCS